MVIVYLNTQHLMQKHVNIIIIIIYYDILG
jgi:hypothetical protein